MDTLRYTSKRGFTIDLDEYEAYPEDRCYIVRVCPVCKKKYINLLRQELYENTELYKSSVCSIKGCKSVGCTQMIDFTDKEAIPLKGDAV